MYKEGDWVKLAADVPNAGLKAGMLGEVTVVLNDPGGKGYSARTLYVVQLLTDGLGVLAPIETRAPIVGEESEFYPATSGEILFGFGAQALKGKLLPSAEPPSLSSLKSKEQVSPTPIVEPPQEEDGSSLLPLLLLSLFVKKDDLASLVKWLCVLIIIMLGAVTLFLVFSLTQK